MYIYATEVKWIGQIDLFSGLEVLSLDLSFFENSVDPDQLAPGEGS